MDLENDLFYMKKKTFYPEYSGLYYNEMLSHINLKKKITWENKELQKKIHNLKINSNLYQIYKSKLEVEEDEQEREKIKSKMECINLFEGDFFKIYFYNFSKFLKSVKDKFYIKFKDNDLENETDQHLFEDFIQLLCSYEFNGNEMRLVSLWNYSFVSKTLEKKNKIIEGHNLINLSSDNKIIFELTENNCLNKIEDGNIVLTIDNIDKYDLSGLL